MPNIFVMKVSVCIVSNASKTEFFTHCGCTILLKWPIGQQFLIISDLDTVAFLLADPIHDNFTDFALHCKQVKVQNKFSGIERAPDNLLIREQMFILECIAN